MSEEIDATQGSSPVDENGASSPSAVKGDSASQDLHDNPRFQEVIAQKNQAKDDYENLKSDYDQLTEKIEQLEKEEDPLPDMLEDPDKYTEHIQSKIIAKMEAKEKAKEKAKEDQTKQADAFITKQYDEIRKLEGGDIDENAIGEFALKNELGTNLVVAYKWMKDKNQIKSPKAVVSKTAGSNSPPEKPKVSGAEWHKMSIDDLIELAV